MVGRPQAPRPRTARVPLPPARPIPPPPAAPAGSTLAGAELELRDLAERVELRVGQQVGRRLGEAERDEHHALGHVAVGARLQLDVAAPRRHAHAVARARCRAAATPADCRPAIASGSSASRWSRAASWRRCASARAGGRWSAPSGIVVRQLVGRQRRRPARSWRARSRSGTPLREDDLVAGLVGRIARDR